MIDGPGANSLTISGNDAVQVFNVTNTATISCLIIADGSASDGSGIYNSGTLTVTNDTFTGNIAANNGAAIDNNGALTVNSSTFTNNSGSTSVCYGGGIYNSGTTTVNNSTFANNGTNTALYEIYEGGGISNHGTMVISDSIFSGNSTDEQGGGIGNVGLMTIINSTIANNSTYALGGGIFNCYGGTLTATNCTIADNSACYGGGILSYASDWGTTTVLNNTIVVNNSGFDIDMYCGPDSVSGSYNLIGSVFGYYDFGGPVNGVNGNIVGVANAGLGTLANNGGPTQTIDLLPGSPAINPGSVALAVDANGNPLTTDQRGIGYPRIHDGTVDIGALESSDITPVQVTPAITWANPADITYGTALGSQQLDATASYDGSTVQGTFAYIPAAGTILNASQGQTLAVTFSPADTVDYTTATKSVSINVNKAGQTISFTAPSSPISFVPNEQVTLDATGGGSGNPVVFSIDASSTGTGSISGNVLTVTAAGSFVLDANQAGNSNYNPATQVQETLVVNKANQTIDFGPLAGQTYGVAPITLTATSSSNLPVSYTVISGPATISGSVLTITGAGLVDVEADQAGNATYAAATPVDESFTATPAPLIVIAKNESMTYGGTVPTPLTYTYMVWSTTIPVPRSAVPWRPPPRRRATSVITQSPRGLLLRPEITPSTRSTQARLQ